MHLLVTALLLAAKFALVVSFKDLPQDLSYGEDPPYQVFNPQLYQDQMGQGISELNDEERKVPPVDPRDGYPQEHFDSTTDSEEPEWNFSEKDWSLIQAGDPEMEDFPTEGLPNWVLDANPLQDATSKIRFALDAANSTRLRLHYKFFIKKDEEESTENQPELRVYLSVNGTLMPYIMEKESKDRWVAVDDRKFDTDTNEKVVFEAHLNSRFNKIALGDVWLEDIGKTAFPEGVGEGGSIKKADDKKTGTSSYTNSRNEEHLSDVEAISPPSARDTMNTFSIATSAEPETTVAPIYESSLPAEMNSFDDLIEASSGNDEDPITPEDSTPNPTPNDGDSAKNSSADDISTLQLDNSGRSIGNSLKIFLIISSLSGLGGFIFIMWRRRRRRRRDDEIPVFSRSSAEHNNPSFTSDAEAEGDRSNYRSFQ